jgi:hypothetical protein
MAVNLTSVEISAVKAQFIQPLQAHNFYIDGIPGVLNVNCQAASLPGVTSEKIGVKFRGRELYYNGTIAKFEDWTVTVREDIHYRSRSAIESWHNIMSNNVLNMGAITPVIQRDLNIYMLAPGVNIPVAQYRLYNAFPYNIGEIAVDQNNDNEVITYSVVFSIDAWERIDLSIPDFVQESLKQSSI